MALGKVKYDYREEAQEILARIREWTQVPSTKWDSSIRDGCKAAQAEVVALLVEAAPADKPNPFSARPEKGQSTENVSACPGERARVCPRCGSSPERPGSMADKSGVIGKPCNNYKFHILPPDPVPTPEQGEVVTLHECTDSACRHVQDHPGPCDKCYDTEPSEDGGDPVIVSADTAPRQFRRIPAEEAL